MENPVPARPRPRVCPWCSSTLTIAASRCMFCGMSLGEELRAAGIGAARAVPAGSTARQAQPPGLQYLLRLLVAAVVVVLTLVVAGVLLHANHL